MKLISNKDNNQWFALQRKQSEVLRGAESLREFSSVPIPCHALLPHAAHAEDHETALARGCHISQAGIRHPGVE